MVGDIESENEYILYKNEIAFKNLKKLNIKFHKLVMGVSGGTRILINDKKPSIPELKTALAYETSRNKNFKF